MKQLNKRRKLALTLLCVLVIIALYWFTKDSLIFRTNSDSDSCVVKKWKEWSIDCGGGIPIYNLLCGHWVEREAISDAGKECSTGKDCCSGFCGKNYNGSLSCLTNETCNNYIDKEGKLHEEICIR